MRQVLVLRPEPGASATMRRADERGLAAIAIPLFNIQPIGWTAPDPETFDGLLLTSANAVRHGGDQLQNFRDLPVFAVGEGTAGEARKKGFRVALVGDTGIDGLLGAIDTKLKLLHLCGEDRRQSVEAFRLVTAIPVYRSNAVEDLDMSPAKAVVALIHSPRAGDRFAELVADPHSIAIAAISRAAADSVGTGWETVEVAEEPTDDALLALAARLCNKPDL